MFTRNYEVLVAAQILISVSSSVVAAPNCPKTIGLDSEYVEGWPEAKTWFGSENFAVILPRDGIWPTTGPRASISVKLFWFIEGFEPGQERGFTSAIKRLDNGNNDAVIARPTSAGGPNLGAWTVLTGIDFPSEGCWKISAEFEGNSLSFVVETFTPAYR